MSLLLSLLVPLLGHSNNRRPEESNHRLCPGVLTTLLGADEQSRALVRWYRRRLIMGDELDDLEAVVSEQGLTLQGLQQAAAGAEERKKSSHAECLT